MWSPHLWSCRKRLRAAVHSHLPAGLPCDWAPESIPPPGLGNPMDSWAWRTIVHGVAKSWAWLSNWTTNIKQRETKAWEIVGAWRRRWPIPSPHLTPTSPLLGLTLRGPQWIGSSPNRLSDATTVSKSETWGSSLAFLPLTHIQLVTISSKVSFLTHSLICPLILTCLASGHIISHQNGCNGFLAGFPACSHTPMPRSSSKLGLAQI